jgi:hypothetical protein
MSTSTRTVVAVPQMHLQSRMKRSILGWRKTRNPAGVGWSFVMKVYPRRSLTGGAPEIERFYVVVQEDEQGDKYI